MARLTGVSAAGCWLAWVVAAAAGADPTAATAPPTADNPQPVKQITLDPTLKPPVCRRYVPTGSRIAKERCESAEVTDAAREAERDQTRRDLAEMRMRQSMRDQARAQAFGEAMRRRGGQ